MKDSSDQVDASSDPPEWCYAARGHGVRGPGGGASIPRRGPGAAGARLSARVPPPRSPVSKRGGRRHRRSCLFLRFEQRSARAALLAPPSHDRYRRRRHGPGQMVRHRLRVMAKCDAVRDRRLDVAAVGARDHLPTPCRVWQHRLRSLHGTALQCLADQRDHRPANSGRSSAALHTCWSGSKRECAVEQKVLVGRGERGRQQK
jgi:hypothetical protein